jgi:leucyl-tRNA synthetase
LEFFPINTNLDFEFEVYDSIPQTFLAQTFTVIAPEHPMVRTLVQGTPYEKEVMEFVAKIAEKKRVNKFDIEHDMEGIFTGRYVDNPFGTGDFPIWIASYVLADYGTGIVNCSAHDARDFAFAKKYNIPLKEVMEPVTGTPAPHEEFRKSIVAIVENPKTGKVLCLDWTPQYGGMLFIGGGREGDEDPVQTALREIREETGYKNLKVIQTSGKTHHHYFAFSKNVARNIEVIGVHLELIDEEKDEVALEEHEKNKFTITWLTKEEAEKRVVDENHALLFQKFIRNAASTTKGILTAPAEVAGMNWKDAREPVIDYIVKKGFGTRKVNYKLRDWVFSRQRYWGEPIPMIHCEACAAKQLAKDPNTQNAGWIPVPEKDLPIKLPNVKNYEPTDTGESPLAAISSWVKTKCPVCKGPARRETDTMPNWAGSSWYFLRYIDPKNSKQLADPKKLAKWMPISWYNGGMEHTTLHLLYSRFWNKFLFDIGAVPTSEPYMKRTSQGMILAEDGEKMSKSRGNVVNPDGIIDTYGADTLRMYEMFMGPFDQSVSWSTASIIGPRRFVEKVWRLKEKVVADKQMNDEAVTKTLTSLIHKTLKKVSADIEMMQFNTAISAMMIAVNELEKNSHIPKSLYQILLQMLAPFAPHITEELWSQLGNKKSIHVVAWPIADDARIVADSVTVIVQVNGKMRGEFTAEPGTGDMELQNRAIAIESVQKWLAEGEIKKVIVVKGKLVNIVIAPKST